MKVIGIDTGVRGGMAFYDTTAKQLLECVNVPSYWQHMKTKGKGGKVKRRRKIDYYKLCDQVETWREKGALSIIIEKVTAMPSNGSVSMFTFGESYGALLAVSVTVGLDVSLVRPQDWKQVYGLSKDKDASLLCARKMFGEQWFPLKSDHNRAEAALIAASGLNLSHEAVLGGSDNA